MPKFQFSKTSFVEMWSFGWKLLVSSLIDTTWQEIYQVVVGKCYSPATLGLYTRAKQFSQLASSNLTTIIQRVSFPVLSSIQDDKERLKSAYRRVIRSTMLPTFVLMLGLVACAKSMILVLIGEKWIECVPLLQLISLTGMLYPLHAINLNMLKVQGRSDLFLKLEIIKKTIGIGPLLLGIFISIYWMLIGTFIISCINYYLNAYYSGPFLGYSIKAQLKDVLPSFAVAIVMAIPVYLVGLLPLSPFILFPIQLSVGAVLAIVISEKAKLPEYLEIKKMAIPVLKKRLNK
jgi:O-antigen/teichoic acid export membrane protein